MKIIILSDRFRRHHDRPKKINSDNPVDVDGKTYLHQTNADLESIRIGCPYTKKPYPRRNLQHDVTYPLLILYSAGVPSFYENARVMSAYDRRNDVMIPVATERWGVGIYVEPKTQEAAQTKIVDFSARLAQKRALPQVDFRP